MKKLLPKANTVYEIFRYGTVTAGSYAFLFLSTALLVELFGANASYSYITMLALTYVGVYLSSVYFVFRTQATSKSMRRYLIMLIISFFVNSGLFALLHDLFGLHYLLVMVLNVAILGPFRYLASKHLVYQAAIEDPDQIQ